ncbi:MAG: hypothetical protein H3Z52_15000 [archaeon]|nr:hypothetical protein [archaeon]
MSSDVVFQTTDYKEVPVKLFRRQLEHVLLKRPWLIQYLNEVKSTVEEPDFVLKGKHGEYLSVKYFEHILGGKHLIVVYKVIESGGFIITIFPMERVDKLIRKRVRIWSL